MSKRSVPFVASFQAALFSFVDLRRNKGFYLAENPFFASQQKQKKKRTARKELLKRTSFSGHVNQLNMSLDKVLL